MALGKTVAEQSDRVANAVGFDPATILTIITTIIGIIQSCKKPANKNAATDMIVDEFNSLAKGKRKDKCPIQFRGVFRQHGIRDKEDQNDIWEAIVNDAKGNYNQVASVLVA